MERWLLRLCCSWATANRKLFVPSVAPGYLDSRIRPWVGAPLPSRGLSPLTNALALPWLCFHAAQIWAPRNCQSLRPWRVLPFQAYRCSSPCHESSVRPQRLQNQRLSYSLHPLALQTTEARGGQEGSAQLLAASSMAMLGGNACICSKPFSWLLTCACFACCACCSAEQSGKARPGGGSSVLPLLGASA